MSMTNYRSLEMQNQPQQWFFAQTPIGFPHHLNHQDLIFIPCFLCELQFLFQTY